MSFFMHSRALMRLLPIWGKTVALAIVLSLAACSGGDRNKLPDNFKSLSTEDKMEYLMASLSPDSTARYICDVAMGKVYNSRIELQQAVNYAYSHYSEDDQVAFAQAFVDYEQALPLHEKVKFAKLAATEDPDMYSYELGLRYVGDIRENAKSVDQVASELAKLSKECKSDPDFYKRFMKGFKTALELDRHHDLDDKIYVKFISYPDSIK